MPSKPPIFRPRPRRTRPEDTRPTAHDRGYGPRWRALRNAHLADNPLCVFHQRRGRVVRATVVDHIRAHKGDPALLFDPGNLQSLCKLCHDALKQHMERGSFRAIGADGFPIEKA